MSCDLPYFVGVDCFQCLKQNPDAISEVLVLKSVLISDQRDQMDLILQESLKKGLKIETIADNSESGQKLKNYGGMACTCKYHVFLDQNKPEPTQFNSWWQFDDSDDTY